jgi:hypothetical protein
MRSQSAQLQSVFFYDNLFQSFDGYTLVAVISAEEADLAVFLENYRVTIESDLVGLNNRSTVPRDFDIIRYHLAYISPRCHVDAPLNAFLAIKFRCGFRKEATCVLQFCHTKRLSLSAPVPESCVN